MQTSDSMRVETKSLSDVMGGEIVSPIDLREPLSDEQARDINEAIYRHQVLVIPNQTITPSEFLRFASRIGRPEPHVNTKFRHPAQPEILILSNVVKDGKPIGLQDGGIHWHTDYSFMETPAKATMLYSVQTPEVGGNTLFSSMYLAYEGLSDALKKQVEDLMVLHCYEIRQTKNDDPRAMMSVKSTPNYEQQGSAVHPLVFTHPVTKRKSLYSPAGTANSIVGMPQDESDDLLDELKAHALKEECRYSQYYSPGDIVVWDNPTLMHAATITAPEYPRTMHRITVMLDKKPWANKASAGG